MLSETQAREIVSKVAAQLSEHFDATQILVTWLDPEGFSHYFALGAGNWYARKALCEAFVANDQAKTLAQEIRAADADGDGETA